MKYLNTIWAVVAAMSFLSGLWLGLGHPCEQQAELIYPALPKDHYNVQPLIHQIEAYQQQGKIEESMNQPSAEVTP